jgi:hypothetical protein
MEYQQRNEDKRQKQRPTGGSDENENQMRDCAARRKFSARYEEHIYRVRNRKGL